MKPLVCRDLMTNFYAPIDVQLSPLGIYISIYIYLSIYIYIYILKPNIYAHIYSIVFVDLFLLNNYNYI